jgi:hypothetical protein
LRVKGAPSSEVAAMYPNQHCPACSFTEGLETFTPEKPKLGLGATESFVDDFFWSRWRFEISVFDLVTIGRG